MPSNPITPEEQYDILINRSLTPRDGVTTDTYMAAGYILMPPATVDGPVKWRLFDAAYVKTGVIDPNRLGTGATGAGNLYLADDGTWKVISGAPGVGDMLKATYDTDNSGVVDNAEMIAVVGRNATGATLYKGTIVYISGSTGNRPNFVKAQANVEATSAGTFGVVVNDIANNSDGYVAHIGVLNNLDTRSSATNPFTDVTLVDGDTVYLHPTIAGYITNVKPSAPNHLVYVGKVTRTSPTNGTIVYRIQNGYEIDELHDVAIASKANNDLLVYESATSLWKNKTFAAIFGGTPLVSVPTLAQVTAAGNTTTSAIIADQYQMAGATRNARLSTDGVGGFDINYNIGGTPDWRWFGGGTTALVTFKANGNVLVGTTTDAGYKLDVAGNTRVNGGNTSADNPFVINSRFQFKGDGVLLYGNAASHGRLTWDGSGAYFTGLSGYGVGLGANGSLNHLFINTSGNVGIGTTSPNQKLSVSGIIEAGSASATSGAVTLYQSYASPNYLGSMSTEWGSGAMILGYGAVGKSGVAGFVSTFANFTGLRAAVRIGQGTFSIFSSTTAVNTAVGSDLTMTETFKVTEAGNVGIGTSTPSYRLDVKGTATTHAISSDIGYNINGVARPTTGSLALVVSAGNVDLGLHYYFVTFTTALGESNPYQIGSITTVSGSQQVTVTIPVSTDSRVTGRKLYRTKAGTNYWETFLLATIAENTSTTYTDNIADASLTGTSGVGFYQVNTTHRAISINGTQSLVADEYATYLGVGAGLGVTSAGGNNTFIGFNSGRWAASANQSVGVGNNALSALTSGGNNIGIGSQAGGITTGSNNILIGRNSGASINTGSYNTIIGSFTWNLGTVTGKLGNTGLGYRVGSNNTGDYNLFLGYDAGYYVTGSNQILLDTVSRADEATAKSSALIYGVTSSTVANQILVLGGGGNVGIGTLTPSYRLDIRGTSLTGSSISAQGSFNIDPLAAPSAIGGYTLAAGTNLGVGQYYYFVTYVTALGETSASATLSVVTTTGNTNVNLTGIPVSSDPRVTARKLYRTKVGQSIDGQYFLATISDNVTTTYTDSTADASLTGVALQYYKINTTARYFTVSGTQGMVIDNNLTAFGRSAGAAIIASGGANYRTVLIGAQAGQSITTGQANVIVGVAGASITTGSNNTLLGDIAGYGITTGYENTFLGGDGVGRYVTTGYRNTFIGNQAGRNLNDGTSQFTVGFENIAIGNRARMFANNDSNSIVIGSNALGLGSNTTVLGNSSTTFTSIPAGNLAVGTTTNAGYKLDVNGTLRTVNDAYFATTSGNVGIGITTPGRKLDVYTDAGAAAATSYLRISAGASGAYGCTSVIEGYYNDYGNGEAAKIGWIQFQGVRPGVNNVGGNINFYTKVLGGLNTADPTLKMTITPAGDVGIGTSTPAQKFDVNGIGKFRSATYFGQINQPGAPTLGTNSTTGGTLPADTYTYRIVALDFWNVETTPSNTLVVTTTGSTSSVSMSWALVQGGYNYRIYRTNSGGTTVYYTNFGTNSTTFTDTGAAGTAGTLPSINNTAYGFYNTNGQLRTGNITIANNGVGNTSSIIFDKSTDSPQINVVEYAGDSTMFEFALADNPDGPDVFHFVMPDWQNGSSGWKPFKFAAFNTQIVGQTTNFWSSFSMPSSTPYYTTNPESLANSQIKWDPYTSTSYNLIKDNGTGTGVFNVDVTGFTGTANTIYWVTIQAGGTTFNWGNGSYGGTPIGTGVAITGGWQTLNNGVQVKITGAVLANDRWAFRTFPVPRMGIGTTTPVAPLQVSTTVRPTSAVAQGVYLNPTLVATANNDSLVALDINPTFTTGAFTGVISSAIRFPNQTYITTANTSSSYFNVFGTDSNSTLRVGHIGLNTGLFGSNLSITGNSVVRFVSNAGTNFVYVYTGTTGNVVLQNGGTFTDAGYRLDVNGTFRAQGSITATLASTSTSNVVYYNSSTGLLTYGAVPTPTTFQIDYDYNIVGVKNGSNVVFTSSANFVLTTTRVYLNGVRLTRGVGYDYVETGTNQITFASAPQPTDQIIIEYQL